MDMMTLLSRHVFYPFWAIKDKSPKMKELKRLLKTERLPIDELKKAQWQKLKNILSFAKENVPYYKDKLSRVDVDSLTTFEEFAAVVPILTKEDVRKNIDNLISSKYEKSNLAHAKTGGSTGVSLDLYMDKYCQELRNAAAMRSDIWSGWNIGEERGALWGNIPKNPSLKSRIRNFFLTRTVSLDTMNMNEKTMRAFAETLHKQNIKNLFGHAHSIYLFAEFCKKNGINLNMKSIIATSMMLLDNEREVIEEVFKCKVQNRYGCEEVSLIASECEKHNGLHLNIDHLYIEFLKNDTAPAKPGEIGAIVVTDLINYGMPLIRYKVGDYGVPSERKCDCGRGLPLMERIVGRVADFLKRRDGSEVAGISMIERTLTKIKGIEQLQIIQKKIAEFELNVVQDSSYTADSEIMLVKEIKDVFGGDISVKINYVTKIRQDRNGKYRFSICEC